MFGIEVSGVWYRSIWCLVSEYLVFGIEVFGVWYRSIWCLVSEYLVFGIRVSGLFGVLYQNVSKMPKIYVCTLYLVRLYVCICVCMSLYVRAPVFVNAQR